MSCVLETAKFTSAAGLSTIGLMVTAQSFFKTDVKLAQTWWSPKWSSIEGGSYINIVAERSSGTGATESTTSAVDVWTASSQSKIPGAVMELVKTE